MRTATERSRRAPKGAVRRDDELGPHDVPPHLRHLVHLQRAAGNAAATRLLTGRGGRYTGLLAHYAAAGGPGADVVAQRQPAPRPLPAASRPPVNVVVSMPLPSTIPPPDYSLSDNDLGAWERANLRAGFRQSFSCDSVMRNGTEHSFVTDVTFEFSSAVFTYFIASHIRANMRDAGLDVGLRNAWGQIHARIRQHAGVHFQRYRAVVDAQRTDFARRLAALPSPRRPVPIPKADLEAHLVALLDHLAARLRYELWDTTCAWERLDYPRLLRGIQGIGGTLTPACDPRPAVPPEPTLPLVVRGGPRRTRRP